MGDITNLQERVRELESVNRSQAVEIFKLKEKYLVLEKKVESLLNSNTESGSQPTHATEAARPAIKRVSFGPILFSDGSTSSLMDGTSVDTVESCDSGEDGDVFGDVEEVDSETLEGLPGEGEEMPHLAHVNISMSLLFFRLRQLPVYSEGWISLGAGTQLPHCRGEEYWVQKGLS